MCKVVVRPLGDFNHIIKPGSTTFCFQLTPVCWVIRGIICVPYVKELFLQKKSQMHQEHEKTRGDPLVYLAIVLNAETFAVMISRVQKNSMEGYYPFANVDTFGR